MAREKKRKRRANRDGSIYKDGDGYRVQILLGYDPATGDPLVKKARVKTHEAAIEKLQEMQALKRQGKLVESGSATLEVFVAHWLKNKVKPFRAPKTFEQYSWVLQTHVLPTLGKRRIDHIRRADVQALVAGLSKQRVKSRAKDPVAHEEKRRKRAERLGVPYEPIEHPLLSRRSLQAAVAVLHSVMSDAIRDGMTATNPCEYVELPKQSNKPPEWLPQGEVDKLVKALNGSTVREIVLFMLGTGARISEARGLRWQDVDFKTGTVRICGQLHSAGGKLLYRPATKSNQDRTFGLSDPLKALLQEIKSKQMVDEIADEDGIVFLNPYGRRFHSKYVWSHLRKACVNAGIKLVSPHKLRHTAATLAIEKTGDLHGVGKMIGHAQIALTADLYGHADAGRLKPVTDALGEILDTAVRAKRQ